MPLSMSAAITKGINTSISTSSAVNSGVRIDARLYCRTYPNNVLTIGHFPLSFGGIFHHALAANCFVQNILSPYILSPKNYITLRKEKKERFCYF